MSNHNVILQSQAISNKLERMAFQIIEQNSDNESIMLLGINNNGNIMALRLLNYLQNIAPNLPIYISNASKKENTFTYSGLENKDATFLILIDDVANTGKTFFECIKQLPDNNYSKIHVACLVDREHKSFPIHCHYVGLRISNTIQQHIEVKLHKENAENDVGYLR